MFFVNLKSLVLNLLTDSWLAQTTTKKPNHISLITLIVNVITTVFFENGCYSMEL